MTTNPRTPKRGRIDLPEEEDDYVSQAEIESEIDDSSDFSSVTDMKFLRDAMLRRGLRLAKKLRNKNPKLSQAEALHKAHNMGDPVLTRIKVRMDQIRKTPKKVNEGKIILDSAMTDKAKAAEIEAFKKARQAIKTQYSKDMNALILAFRDAKVGGELNLEVRELNHLFGRRKPETIEEKQQKSKEYAAKKKEEKKAQGSSKSRGKPFAGSTYKNFDIQEAIKTNQAKKKSK